MANLKLCNLLTGLDDSDLANLLAYVLAAAGYSVVDTSFPQRAMLITAIAKLVDDKSIPSVTGIVKQGESIPANPRMVIDGFVTKLNDYVTDVVLEEIPRTFGNTYISKGKHVRISIRNIETAALLTYFCKKKRSVYLFIRLIEVLGVQFDTTDVNNTPEPTGVRLCITGCEETPSKQIVERSYVVADAVDTLFNGLRETMVEQSSVDEELNSVYETVTEKVEDLLKYLEELGPKVPDLLHILNDDLVKFMTERANETDSDAIQDEVKGNERKGRGVSSSRGRRGRHYRR